jgi:hypothetical protein
MAIDVAGGAARADVFSRGAIAYHILTRRSPVTNPFDLPSRLREGNGLLLSGTMNGARPLARRGGARVRGSVNSPSGGARSLQLAAALSWSVSDTDCGLIKNSPPTGRLHKA